MALRFPIDFPNNTPVLLADQILINASGTNTTSFSTVAQIFASGNLFPVGLLLGVSTNTPLAPLDVEGNLSIKNSSAFAVGMERRIIYNSSTISFGVQPIVDLIFTTTGDAASTFAIRTRNGAGDFNNRFTISEIGHIGFSLAGIPVFANNAGALGGGLVVGQLYRNGADPDHICIVH
jgi:hypothetical protein